MNKTLILIALLLLIINNTEAEKIHDAVKNGDMKKVQILLANDANLLNAKDKKGMAPLHLAIEAGHDNISFYLIENGADVSIKDGTYGATPLHYASAKGNLEIARVLVEKNRSLLEEGDQRQKTPLLTACENGHPRMVKYLLDCGANIHARDQLGLTPLMGACEGWNMEIVRMLVAKGVDINDFALYQGRQYTALTVAALYGFREMVDYLIELKAKIHESVRELTLQYAVQGDNIHLFEYVREKGLDIVNCKKEKHQDLLYMASAAGSIEIYKLLNQLGFDPYKQDRYGWTVLHHAASRGNNDMIEFLLDEEGADINDRSLRGETAYNVADFLGHDKTVQFLRTAGVDTAGAQFPKISGLYMGQEPPEDFPEMFMPGIVSGPYRAHGTVVFSPDGKEAYWSDMIPGSQSVLEMKMINDQWTFPVRSIMWKDPSISPDGGRLIYISREPVHENDPGGKENYWYMDRTDSGWTEPKPMDTIINNINIHWQCSMDLLGNLYFSEFENNMYVSEFRDGKYHEPVNLKIHFNNRTLNGRCPFISPSGDYLIFSDIDRLHISFKTDEGTWTDRVDLGEKINSEAGIGSPRVSHDGKYLFFQSTSGEERPWGIYWVSADIIEQLRREQLPIY